MSWLRQLTPAVTLRTRLALCGVLWGMAGVMLCVRGSAALLAGGRLWLVVPAFFLGLLKGRLLARTAKKNIERLLSQPGKRCVGGVYSWGSWLFVAMMVGFGMFLPILHVDLSLYGTILLTVGLALFWGSLPCFAAFRNYTDVKKISGKRQGL